MDDIRKPIGRRAVFAGAAGLGLATLVGGTLVRAQDTPDTGESTPTTGTDTDTDTTTDETTSSDEVAAGARYDDFVSRLASHLGIADSTQVDTGIRTTLTDLVDARLAAGEISANDADAARTAITDSPAPLGGLFRAGHGDGPGGFGRGRGDSNDSDSSDQDDDDTDATDETTPATPAATV